jgi:hypothetical protein
LEQEEVLVATTLKVVLTVLLLYGVVTVTPAKAEAAKKTEMAVEMRNRFFISILSG